jgi:biopolymer transport protein ExbD
MRLHSKRNRETVLELSNTSMIDIVFLLLIFFLATSSFVKAEREYRPSIQVNEKSAASKPNDLEQAIVDIVKEGDAFVFQVGQVKIKSDAELIGLLKTLGNKEQGAFVRAPDDAPFDLSARANAACRTAGFVAVTYVPLDAGK